MGDSFYPSLHDSDFHNLNLLRLVALHDLGKVVLALYNHQLVFVHLKITICCAPYCVHQDVLSALAFDCNAVSRGI